MIRIDEIYTSVFASAFSKNNALALHWFDPYGSTNFKDLVSEPKLEIADLRLIFWDQEPIYRETAELFFNQYCERFVGPHCVITSELNSTELDWLCDTYQIEKAYYFFHGWAALDWFRGYNFSYLQEPWHNRILSKRLFCPNNIVSGKRHHRLHLLRALYDQDCISNNHISFPSQCPFSGLMVEDLFREQEIEMPDLNFPLVIDSENNHARNSARIDFWSQGLECFCHIVTETIFDNSKNQKLHLTEKIFKPIVMQQPFMLIGPRGGLRYLRSYGFKTFNDFWDERYDDLDGLSRIKAVADVAHQINTWPDHLIKIVQQEMKDVIQYNFNWFYGGFKDLLWKEIQAMIRPWK